MRVLRADGHDVVGLDILASPYTDVVGSIADRALRARAASTGVDAVLHAATLHKPHVGSHTPPGVRRHQHHRHAEPAGGGGRRGRRALRLHEHDQRVRARADARRPARPRRGSPRTSRPVPRNIYGVTKTAAEDLCELVHRDHGLPCLILRTSRFFPEADDRDDVRAAYDDANLKVNELLYRRVDLEDVVERAPARARARAASSASAATSSAPRRRSRATTSRELRADAPAVVRAPRPRVRASCTTRRGWRMFPTHRARLRQRARARASSAGRRATTSRHALERLARRRGRRAARSPPRSAPRATTPSRPGRTRSADRRTTWVGSLTHVTHSAAAGRSFTSWRRDHGRWRVLSTSTSRTSA